MSSTSRADAGSPGSSGSTGSGADAGRLVEIAAAAAVQAGTYLTGRYGSGSATTSKGARHDVVTVADGRAETLIRAALSAACPGGVVVGEEQGESGGTGGAGGAGGAGDGGDATEEAAEEAAGHDVRWYVDPVDGTHNFARGLGMFAVSIGVRVAGRWAGGVVYDPVRGELFTAAGGVLRMNGEPPARAGHGPDPLPMVLTDIPTAGLRDPAEFALFAELLETADVRRIGSSALALAHVAAGRADLAANADVFVWDVAAGRVLVEAAGGGFAGVPGEPGTDRRTGFVAWGPGFEEAGRRLAASLAGAAHLAVRNATDR
ncbi:inositol monophosphatase [Microbispora sp. RL4-1S]|uniref:inositol-phosphate phosphatase n=1 Tax=Microbispora oryzae TaxID=2806554 RepID=A0A940WEQ9_9ACTN|nr:inositol monophosphatase [Microbispora oryzae]MBP2702782.1 inositol monophosphatase [Microbispora oryzae]